MVVGFGMLWAPFGAGACALMHRSAAACDEAAVLAGGNWPAAVCVAVVCVEPPEEPHAMSASAAVAVAEQHSSTRVALKREDIGAA